MVHSPAASPSVSIHPARRWGTALAAGALCAALAASCVSSPEPPEPEKAIHRAVGAPVAFRWVGAPVDVPVGEGGTLTLATAVQKAVQASPELQAALARVRASEAEAELASLLPNPVLSLAFRFPEGGGGTRVEAGLGAELLAILQRRERARIAGQRLEAEAAGALTAALDVVAEVEQRYAAVQALEEALPLLDEQRALLARLREVAQARLELGEGTRHDVTTLDAEGSALSVEIAARRQELRLARLALARTLGEPSAAADWQLEPWIVSAPPAATEQAWIAAALANRPEILAIEWELRAREGEEALVVGLQGASVGLDAERDGDWSLGPAFSTPLPIFDRGAARSDRARALSAEERHRLTQAQRAVIEEVRTSLAASTGAAENLARVDDELLPLQAQRRGEIEEVYRQGFVGVTALLQADQALQATRARRVDLALQLALARSRLERAVGGPAPFLLVSQETP